MLHILITVLVIELEIIKFDMLIEIDRPFLEERLQKTHPIATAGLFGRMIEEGAQIGEGKGVRNGVHLHAKGGV